MYRKHNGKLTCPVTECESLSRYQTVPNQISFITTFKKNILHVVSMSQIHNYGTWNLPNLHRFTKMCFFVVRKLCHDQTRSGCPWSKQIFDILRHTNHVYWSIRPRTIEILDRHDLICSTASSHTDCGTEQDSAFLLLKCIVDLRYRSSTWQARNSITSVTTKK